MSRNDESAKQAKMKKKNHWNGKIIQIVIWNLMYSTKCVANEIKLLSGAITLYAAYRYWIDAMHFLI